MPWLLRRTYVAQVLCVVLCMATCCLAGSATVRGDRYALLVGCTEYRHLDRAAALHGPANDVVLLRSVLQSRFGFTDSQVTVLAEAVGDAAHRPTRANIEREFRRLADCVEAGDQVVILMAGHGSQQPDDDPDNPDDPEPDGLDEVFCAADVAQLKPGRGNVIPGAISDDELRRWLAAITAQGANVWIIVDACHSGTMTRGSGQQVVRRIPAQSLLPQAALAASRVVGHRSRGIETAHDKPAQLNPRPVDGRLVALFASQPDELTVETRIPKRGQDSKWYGLLTFTLARVLAETNGPLTYQDLAQQIQRRYIQSGRTFPTPFVEGPLRDREVLGPREWPTKPAMTVAASAAWVRPLNVAVDIPADGNQEPARQRAELKLQLRALTESQASLLKVVDSVEQADWLVRKRAGQVTLVPAEGWAGSSGMAASGEFGPAPASGFEDWLSNRLQRIARARNLLAVALAESHNQEHGRKQVDVEVTLLRMKDSTDRVGTPVNWQANGRVVREGEIIGFQVQNRSRMAVDVTFLFVDSGYGIQSNFPPLGKEGDTRVGPGATVLAFRSRVTSCTTGLEHMIVIAVPRADPPLSFRFLAQPTIERRRQRTRGLTNRGTQAPLGQFLLWATTTPGKTRSAPRLPLGDYQMDVISWRTCPSQ